MSIKQPTIVANVTAAMDHVAADTTRSRPVVAINQDGKLVVCCKTTAKKHGWEVQGKLYARTRSGDVVPAVTATITPKKAAAKRPTMKAQLQVEELLK